MKKFYIKRFASAILISAMLVMLLPMNVANATAYSYNATTGIVTVTADKGSYFYRLPFDYYGNAVTLTQNQFAYGYGYGYSAGTYSYGYGYGYGYGYFADNAPGWSAGDARLGFYMGTGSGNQTGATFPVTAGGVATVAVETTLQASGLSNVSIVLPQGLQMTGSAGWNGSVSVTGSTTYTDIPAAIRSSFSSGSAVALVTVATGLSTAVTLSTEIVVRIPYSNFPSTGVVMIVDGAGTTYTVSACSASEYTGASTDAAYLTATNYVLSAGDDCYKASTSYVYVATLHLTSFAAGAAPSTSTTGGVLLGGGSGSKKVAVEEEEEVEEEVTEEEEKAISEKAEEAKEEALGGEAAVTVENLDKIAPDVAEVLERELGSDRSAWENDWRAIAIMDVINAGLMIGELQPDGTRKFNMEGSMNRAMMAETVARWIGCPVNHVTVAPFPDVPVDKWYASAVVCLKDKGIVIGKNGLFAPADPVTRAEALKFIIEALFELYPALENAWRWEMLSAKTVFEDVSSDDWFFGYAYVGNKYELIKGYTVGGKKLFKGNQSIIRVEMAKIWSNVLAKIKSGLVDLGDPPGY